MPPNSPSGLIEALHNLIGGAATALAAAMTGRLMWHASEVRAHRRPVLSWDLLWELPLAFGMAMLGDGLGSYLDLSDTTTVALIAGLSYLGPRGVGAMMERWLNRKAP